MLSLGGDTLRTALIAQLLEDFGRIARSLQAEAAEDQARAAHELKGLAATIGAGALADHAARFDSMVAESTPAVRTAMALGLGRQIDRLCATLRAADRNTTAA